MMYFFLLKKNYYSKKSFWQQQTSWFFQKFKAKKIKQKQNKFDPPKKNHSYANKNEKKEVETKQQWKKVTLDAPKNQALGALDYKKSRNSLNPSI